MADADSAREGKRKEYSSPKILHTEPLTSRATVCNKADITCLDSGKGIIQS